jgi:uncharacterized protein (DUF1800 family)
MPDSILSPILHGAASKSSYGDIGHSGVHMRRNSVLIKLFTTSIFFSLLAPVVAVADPAIEYRSGLSEDQKIVHLLNRITFGPSPGDLERVRSIGISRYIQEQLNPEAIDDQKAEARVKRLDIFDMSTAEIFAKYPNPGALLIQLNGRNRQDRTAAAGTPGASGQTEMTEDDRRERRRKLEEYYRKYGLRPAGQLVPQIAANRVLRAVYSERQLHEVMVDFWQNHFNVYSGKAAVRWYIPSYERDVLRRHALGNFRDLVVGTAQHPAMLFYLDNYESVSPDGQMPGGTRGNGRLRQAVLNGNLTPRLREQIKRRQGLTDAELDQRIDRLQTQAGQARQRMRRGLNENYARELMELHTLGVDGGYTQNDIVDVAKAFTGWTIADPRGYRRAAGMTITGQQNKQLDRLRKLAGVPDDIESGEFYFNERWHDRGAKTVLGQKVNEGGIKDGLKVIDLLVNHPSTAKFIARKLAVKFVSDTPNEQLVARVADAFTRSKGDIKVSLRALFNDKEFYSPANYRAKIKTPFELAISSIRALGGESNAGPAFVAMLNKLGEVPYGYQAPTGYPDSAEDWVNTGALLERLNFAVALASNRIPGTRVDLNAYSAPDRKTILDRAIREMLAGDISKATRAGLMKQLEQPLPEVKAGETIDDEIADDMDQAPAPTRGRMNRQARLLPPSGDPEVFKVVSLVLGTPEFQRQ